MNRISKTNYKKIMSKFATGVSIVTINYKNIFIGKTVNSIASLSLNPSLILFSLDKKSSSLLNFKKSKNIGINFLSKKQKNLSIHFAKKNNKWSSTSYFLNKKKVPLIKNSLVNLSCINYKMISIGDHIIFICKVKEFKLNNNLKPLIYINSKYI